MTLWPPVYINSSHQCWKLAVVSVCISSSDFQHDVSVCGQPEIWFITHGLSAVWLAMQQTPALCLAGAVPIWQQLPRCFLGCGTVQGTHTHWSSPSESGSSRGTVLHSQDVVDSFKSYCSYLGSLSSLSLSLAPPWDQFAWGNPRRAVAPIIKKCYLA